MPTVDLSQLPQPAIIEVLDFEVILAEIKQFMIS
ncbi:baseplate assembly protein, partial [Salmonella enterica subsp. enterica]